MDITKFSIEKKSVSFTFIALMAVFGLITFFQLPRAEDPGFPIRTATVTTVFPGASPNRVEQLVTDKLEKVIQEMSEVDVVRSETKPGLSIIFVDLKEHYKKHELQEIWDKLRRKVERGERDLPQGVIGPFVNDEYGDIFGTIVAITGDDFSYAELKEIADEVRNDFLLLQDVGKVDIYGDQEERVFVEFNNARLAKLGLSPLHVQQMLEARNIIFPGGEIFTDDEQIVLEPSGNFESVEELGNTIIQLPGTNDVIYLKDVVHIERGYVDPTTRKMTYNGQSALALAINKREGGDIIRLGKEIKELIFDLKTQYPIGVNFDIAFFEPAFVAQKIDDFTVNLIQAVLIVMGVTLLALGLRTGLIVTSLVPMTILVSFGIMGIFNIGLDQMSLSSLIISLGLLVDNSIVVAESILVQMSQGKRAVKAAIDSAKELKLPLLIASLTTSAAFLPIFISQSDTGDYCRPLFKVVTIALLSSWVLAMTLIPLLCTLFMKVKPKTQEETFDSRGYQSYRKGLILGLRHPVISLILSIIVFAGFCYLFRFIDQIFFPKNQNPIMYAQMKFPVGTPIEKTERMIQSIDQFIGDEMQVGEDERGVREWMSFMGKPAPRFMLTYQQPPEGAEFAYILITTSDRDIIDEGLIEQLEDFVFDNFPDLLAEIKALPLGTPVHAPIEVRLIGRDSQQLFEYAEQVKVKLAEIDGVRNVRDDWGMRNKKLKVKVNQARAHRAGITNQDIAVSLQTILSGIDTTVYREDDDLIPVVLRSVEADRKDVSKLESLNLYVQRTGQSVPLKQVADIEMEWQPAKIKRRQRLQAVTIEADPMIGGNQIYMASQIIPWMKEFSKEWPFGYHFEMGGDWEASWDSQMAIVNNLWLAMLSFVLLLVFQFDSVRKAAIILLTIPYGLIGVTVGLLVTQLPFGFTAFLGLISLSGIVINNAIVLLDRQRILMEEGLGEAESLIQAAMQRLRPILLTTATTIGGLIPLWLGGGPLFKPMAVAIIFGLAFATVLSLGLVPVFYVLFYRVEVDE